MTDKRVPREPTQAMEQAAYEVIPIAPGTETWAIGRYPHPDKLWRAMYDAAPAVPDERDAQIARLNGLIEKQIEELVEWRGRCDALKAALRRVAVVAGGGIYRWRCLQCNATWEDRAERHAPGCLAAPEDAPS